MMELLSRGNQIVRHSRDHHALERTLQRDRRNHLRVRSVRRSHASDGRGALGRARQWLITIGEVLLDGLVTGFAAVVAFALVGATALACAVVLLEWWF